MAIPRRIQEFFDRKGAKYTHSIHSPSFTARELARAEHVPAWEVAKAVVFVGDGCYAMAVLPGDERVEIKKLKSALGLADVRLATEEELGELFPECEIGAMPPLGNLFGLPVYVDDRLASQEFIDIQAGTHRDTVRMRFAEFTRLTQPVLTRFGELAA